MSTRYNRSFQTLIPLYTAHVSSAYRLQKRNSCAHHAACMRRREKNDQLLLPHALWQPRSRTHQADTCMSLLVALCLRFVANCARPLQLSGRLLSATMPLLTKFWRWSPSDPAPRPLGRDTSQTKLSLPRYEILRQQVQVSAENACTE